MNDANAPVNPSRPQPLDELTAAVAELRDEIYGLVDDIDRRLAR